MAKNPFADALAAHDLQTLRAAFEACQQGDATGYDRTTLNTWLNQGSVPTREPFIRCLSERLEDPGLYTAWQQARKERSPSRVKDVVTRFEGLNTSEKDTAFHRIRRDYVSEYPSIRERLSYRIEISDSDDPDDDHLQVTLDWSWVGDIPASANVQYVSAYAELTDAYADAGCVFREELLFNPDRLRALLEAGEDQVLSITPLGTSNPRAVRHVGHLGEHGHIAFENSGATNAEVEMSLSYPYPKGRPLYLIRFGGYQIPDTVDIRLILRTKGATEPTAFPYLPPGRQTEWSSNRIRSNELSVRLGTGNNTVLSEGDGVVLYWTEN